MEPIKAKKGEIFDIELEEDLLKKNEELARQNRKILEEYEILAIDIMGSIGTGKTSLIKSLIFHFWLKELFKDTSAQGAKIYIKKIFSRIKCKKCEHEGSMSLKDDPFYHVYLPPQSPHLSPGRKVPQASRRRVPRYFRRATKRGFFRKREVVL